LLATVRWLVNDKESCVLGNFRRNYIPYPTKDVETIDAVIIDVLLDNVDAARVGRRGGTVSNLRQRKIL
jgi:hypothetical protein